MSDDTLFDLPRPTPPGMQRSAKISADGVYRYGLFRRWDGLTRTLAPREVATFVMLNPSTADGETDDPTIRRCVGFARAWGMSALVVLNLYAYRATDPKMLRRVDDPVGSENDLILTEHLAVNRDDGGRVIAAWGGNAETSRVRDVLALVSRPPLYALGVTAAGMPRHPLYLRGDAQPTPWSLP